MIHVRFVIRISCFIYMYCRIFSMALESHFRTTSSCKLLTSSGSRTSLRFQETINALAYTTSPLDQWTLSLGAMACGVENCWFMKKGGISKYSRGVKDSGRNISDVSSNKLRAALDMLNQRASSHAIFYCFIFVSIDFIKGRTFDGRTSRCSQKKRISVIRVLWYCLAGFEDGRFWRNFISILYKIFKIHSY